MGPWRISMSDGIERGSLQTGHFIFHRQPAGVVALVVDESHKLSASAYNFMDRLLMFVSSSVRKLS